MVYGLQMPRKRKLMICGIFLLGGLWVFTLIDVLNSSLIVIRPEFAWARFCDVITTARRDTMTSPVRPRSFLTLLSSLYFYIF